MHRDTILRLGVRVGEACAEISEGKDAVPLPDLPPLFWTRVDERVAYWQSYCAQSDPAPAPIHALREECIARIKTRLKRINAGKNAGRSLFELADYVACLTVIDSRN